MSDPHSAFRDPDMIAVAVFCAQAKIGVIIEPADAAPPPRYRTRPHEATLVGEPRCGERVLQDVTEFFLPHAPLLMPSEARRRTAFRGICARCGRPRVEGYGRTWQEAVHNLARKDAKR